MHDSKCALAKYSTLLANCVNVLLDSMHAICHTVLIDN